MQLDLVSLNTINKQKNAQNQTIKLYLVCSFTNQMQIVTETISCYNTE